MKERIELAHGGGGRLSRELIEREIISRFGEGPLLGLPDAAVLNCSCPDLVFSTDSFVVQPLIFPGGNIGDLAVHGTVNDIAVAGGSPRFLSLALILEEGLEIDTLRIVLDSIKRAAAECGVSVVTGDTKVVKRGQCDEMYVNTAGIGERIAAFSLSPSRIEAGDVVLTSGTLGDHGMAVMSVREGMNLTHGPKSDTGPVHRLVKALEGIGSRVKFMRDPTRGGLASVLHEIIQGQQSDIVLNEKDLPFSEAAKAVAEMLGLDLLHVASEGRVLAICTQSCADEALKRWQELPEGQGSRIIGVVRPGSGKLILETLAGGRRLVDVPEGELLPRIC